MALNSPKNRYIGILALIAGLILVVGWQWRPTRSTEAAPSQADLTRLARLSQKNNLEGMASFFADVARQVSSGLVWVEGLESHGIVWDQSGAILSANEEAHPHLGGAIRGVDEGDIPLQTELYSAPLGFRMMKAPPELALTPLRLTDTKVMRPGNWLVSVWRTSAEHLEFDPGIYSASRPIVCGGVEVVELLTSFGDKRRRVGSAIFNLDGQLAGVILPCGEEVRVIAATSLGKAVERARAVDSQLQFRYGFRPVELESAQRQYFAVEKGLLVAEVWLDTLAWDLGLRPGDIVTALDGEAITRLDDLAMMTVPMYRPEYTLTVRRGRISRETVFPPGAGLGSEEIPAPTHAIVVEQPSLGAAIRTVEPGTAAARAGLRSGDQLISVGPQYSASRFDPSLLTADRQKPLYVVISRGNSMMGLFLN